MRSGKNIYDTLSKAGKRKLEEKVLESCKGYLAEGYSVTFSIHKAFFNSTISKKHTMRLVRESEEVQALIKQRVYTNNTSSRWLKTTA